MDANEIAAALNEIAILLELRGENVFKINAYRKAARALETLTQPLDNLIAEGNLAKVDGIGKALLIKIETLHKTNRLEELEHLRGLVPPGLLEMLRLPGIGPKKVKALYEELGIASLVALKEACESDQIAKVKGFGPKTQVNILEGIAFLKEGEGRVHRPIALEVANDLVNRLRQIEGVQRIEIAEACADCGIRSKTLILWPPLPPGWIPRV